MLSSKALNSIEYYKIIEKVCALARLDDTKANLLAFKPETNYDFAKTLLNKTTEAYVLNYELSKGAFPNFDACKTELLRAKKGGILSNNELFRVKGLLKASRIIRNDLVNIDDERILILKSLAKNIVLFDSLEEEIDFKIISFDKINDNSSVELFQIRKKIKVINERIREKLNSYIHGGLSKYLQDNVITIRGDRYVVPVKSEFKGYVKGLIHDQSQSGATLFIEPQQIIEYNNELKTALLEEKREVERILQDLSFKVGASSDTLLNNYDLLVDIDLTYAKAEYAYKTKSVAPILNNKGVINIINGRHPLIDSKLVVPVSVSLGKYYNFLLITGPNTGGKTVTLKLTGLLTAMAMSGLYVPAELGTEISVFNNIFCDIGDEQSIEQSLSTFSSHMKNINEIIENLDNKSLILFDELGAGTDPEEGSSLALAIIEHLLNQNCYGIITSHYSRLKEFAFTNSKIENASMDFDSQTFSPLYKLIIGIPGSSNAIEISNRIGLPNLITNRAKELLSDRKIAFEKVLKKAEETRHNAERVYNEYLDLKNKILADEEFVKKEKNEIIKEREKIKNSAKIEVKKIVNERLLDAEEIIENLTKILGKEEITAGDLITARTLKNKLKNTKYLLDDEVEIERPFLKQIDFNALKEGDYVFVKSFDNSGYITKLNKHKKEAEVRINNISTIVKFNDLFYTEPPKQSTKNVKVNAFSNINTQAVSEINLLGKTVLEATIIIDAFINDAVMANLQEVKIIHGVGTGKLKEGVKNHLKNNKFVKSMRPGTFGEGEIGVTIVTLKV